MSFLSRMSFPVALLLVLVWVGQPTVSSATQPAAGTDAPRAERPPRLSNKWRLEFSGAAESAGEIVLEIVPRGEAPVLVRAVIERNDGENRVARKVKTAIDRQAGRWVDAELDDGEDVLVKRNLFRPRVSVRLVSSTVKDVRINFDRE